MVYAGVVFSLTRVGQWLLVPLLGVVAASVIWFVWVQARLIGDFCPSCVTIHFMGSLMVAVGVVHAARAPGWSSTAKPFAGFCVAGLLTVGLTQSFGAGPVTHRIDETASVSIAEPAGVHARGVGRKVSFANGSRVYNIDLLPHVGSSKAKQVMVEYFDYQCGACRTMHGFLKKLIERHPQALCVILMPVPLDRSCNRSLDALNMDYTGSCEYARLALALWRVDRGAFSQFHERVLQGASFVEAQRVAVDMVPAQTLDQALRDPWIDEMLQANIADWVAFSKDSKHLPKLLITGTKILHGLPSGEEDFIRVMERELGLSRQ